MNKPLLNKEINLFRPFFTALIVCVISGAAIYVNSSLSWWAQLNVLGHVLFGIVLSFICLPYFYLHLKRTLGIRKLAMIVSGLITTLLFLGYLYIGLHLAIIGHLESQPMHLLAHRYGSLGLGVLIALHFLLHLWIKSRRDKSQFHSLKAYSFRQGLIALGLYILCIALATLAYNFYHSKPPKDELTQDYQYQYGEHPFRPSQSETPNSDFISEKEISGSNECAFCHTEIAKQWSSSIHRHAASDPAYVTNINLLEKNKGISSTRYCEGCHAPIALLSGQLTPGGKHGGIENTVANKEGISCLSCHRITHAENLDGVASYHYAPAQEYLFQYSESLVLKQINRYLLTIYTREHKKDMSQPILKKAEHCATCHAQFMDKDMNDWGWVKMQDDYSAWLRSPYSQQHEKNFSNKDLVRCQDCHMPLVSAADPSANDNGKVRSHRFIAANTMVPLLNGDSDQLNQTIAFLQSNKMRITIEPPNRKQATQSTLNLDESLRIHTELPAYYHLGETVLLNIIVSNTGVGHDFPGGTIDINQAWVYLNVRDAEGRSIFKSGDIDLEDNLDQQAHRYEAIPVSRQGKAVWRHDLFNMTGETYRNVIKAGSSDVVSYKFDLPHWVKGPLVVDALLQYRKLNTKYAKWALQDKYRPLPIVTMARDSRVIEVRNEPRVYSQ